LELGTVLAPAAAPAVAVNPAAAIGVGASAPSLMMSMMSGGPEDGSGDLKSVEPTGEPFTDPDPPDYKRGHPSNPVEDHILNRARGGDPVDPSNLDTKTWEANSRKPALRATIPGTCRDTWSKV